MINIRRFLQIAIDKKSSDLHLSVGMPPMLRIHGELVPLTEVGNITSQDMKDTIFSVLNANQKERFEKELDLDCSLNFPGIGRFRVNIYMAQQDIGASFRIIMPEIKSLEELGLPPILSKFCLRKSGLIIITGPTGSGKSTTLAAMVESINEQRKCRIIIIEDPIEYIHHHKKSMIFQREVYEDTKSFSIAVRQSLRQDPNVICVGEMRDLETISTVLTAAETGHLVFSTLHTPNTVETINRIIDIFPPYQQEQVRIQLSSCLEIVVAQRLLPTKDLTGRAVATEILVANSAIKHLIRTGKTEQIYSILQTGVNMNMHDMDKSILALYQKGIIEKNVALSELRDKTNRENLERLP